MTQQAQQQQKKKEKGKRQKKKDERLIIKDRIVFIMRNHIGKSNAITPKELFIKVFGRNPDDLHVFEKNFYWNLILILLHELRKENRCFVINRVKHLFVLETQEECNDFIKRMDSVIKAIEFTQDRGIKWVNEKRFKNMR